MLGDFLVNHGDFGDIPMASHILIVGICKSHWNIMVYYSG
jgi:hypothetical protein